MKKFLKLESLEIMQGKLIKLYGLLAQPVEHLTFNQGVPGSNPGQATKHRGVAKR